MLCQDVLGHCSPRLYLAWLPRPSQHRQAQEGRLKTSCLRGDTTSLTLSIVNIVYLPHLLSKGHADGAAPAPHRPTPPTRTSRNPAPHQIINSHYGALFRRHATQRRLQRETSPENSPRLHTAFDVTEAPAAFAFSGLPGSV